MKKTFLSRVLLTVISLLAQEPQKGIYIISDVGHRSVATRVRISDGQQPQRTQGQQSARRERDVV